MPSEEVTGPPESWVIRVQNILEYGRREEHYRIEGPGGKEFGRTSHGLWG